MMNKIRVLLMTDEVYATSRNYAADLSAKIKEHPESFDWFYAFANGSPFEDTAFEIDDFDVLIPSSKEDFDAMLTTALNLYNAVKGLPKHILGDVRFWAWLSFTKLYKFILASSAATVEGIVTFWLPKGTSARRSFMLQPAGQYFYMSDLAKGEAKEPESAYVRYLLENQQLYINMVYRNFIDIPNIAKNIVRATMEYESSHAVKVPTRKIRKLLKLISEIGSVRLMDAIPEEELYSMINERLESAMAEADEDSGDSNPADE